MNTRKLSALGLLTLWVSTTCMPQATANQKMSPYEIMATCYLALLCIPVAKTVYNKALKPVIFCMQKVGVVTIDGVITDSRKVVGQLRTFFDDKSIKAIVLKINSGGGAPGASQAIYQIVRELKAIHEKPVVAWVENVAASGAYYIAAAADVIVAAPSALVGSIGVIASQYQLKSFLKNLNIGNKVTTAGDYKASTNPFNDMTPEQQQMIQDVCDSIYKRFVSDMQDARPPLAELAPTVWANGQFFDADRGIELKLVDHVGSQLTVEKIVKELTGKTSAIAWIYPPKPLGQALFGHVDGDQDSDSYLAMAVDTIYTRLAERITLSTQLRTELSA